MLETITMDGFRLNSEIDMFNSYEVKIIEKPTAFTFGSHERKSKYTASVTFYGDDFTKNIEYAILNKNAIYRLIDSKQPVQLSNVYVKGFSISDYKKQKGIDKYEDIILKAFDAEQCFFDEAFDLSMTKIQSDIAKFNDTIFAGGFVDFRMTTFLGNDTQFLHCIFFDGIIEFSEVEFTGEAEFTWSTFHKTKTYFRSANIKNCDFACVDIHICESDIFFEGTSFDGSDITFSARQKKDTPCNLVFSGIACEGGRYDFSGNRVSGDIMFLGCYFDNALILRGVQCENLIIRDCTITDMLDINNRKDHAVSFSTICLLNTIVSGNIFLDWDLLNIRKAIKKQQGTSHFNKASQYVMLKENYSSLGLYEYEDEAYVAFKRHQRKGRFHQFVIIKRKRDWWHIPLIPFYALFHFFFRVFSVDIISKYATSPLRVAVSMIGAILAFAIPYAMLIDFSSIPLPPVMAPIYYSAVNFLTIGDAGIQVLNPIVMVMCTIEGFIGLLLITYFTTALVRKILR